MKTPEEKPPLRISSEAVAAGWLLLNDSTNKGSKN